MAEMTGADSTSHRRKLRRSIRPDAQGDRSTLRSIRSIRPTRDAKRKSSSGRGPLHRRATSSQASAK